MHMEGPDCRKKAIWELLTGWLFFYCDYYVTLSKVTRMLNILNIVRVLYLCIYNNKRKYVYVSIKYLGFLLLFYYVMGEHLKLSLEAYIPLNEIFKKNQTHVLF